MIVPPPPTRPRIHPPPLSFPPSRPPFYFWLPLHPSAPYSSPSTSSLNLFCSVNSILTVLHFLLFFLFFVLTFCWHFFGDFFYFFGQGLKTVLGSTHQVEQVLFSMFSLKPLFWQVSDSFWQTDQHINLPTDEERLRNSVPGVKKRTAILTFSLSHFIPTHQKEIGTL